MIDYSKIQDYGLSGLQPGSFSIPENIDDPKLYKACQGFEAYFARQMIERMRGETNIIGGSGIGADIYQGMFDNIMSDVIASTSGLGIAEMMYRQITEGKGISTSPLTGQGDDIGSFLIEENRKEAHSPVPGEDFRSESKARHIDSPLKKFEKIIEKSAKRYGLDPDLVRAVILQESGGNPFAVSSKGAKGLMQLMDSTAREENVIDPFNPAQNIYAGAKYLRKQLDEFEDIQHALAAYNAGPTRVKQYNGIPPFLETENYVKKVISRYQQLKAEKPNG